MTDANVIVWWFVPKDETVISNGQRAWRPRPIIVTR